MNGSNPVTAICLGGPGPIEVLASNEYGFRKYGASRSLLLQVAVFGVQLPEVYPTIARRGSGGESGSKAYDRYVSERVQSIFFTILSCLLYKLRHLLLEFPNIPQSRKTSFLASSFACPLCRACCLILDPKPLCTLSLRLMKVSLEVGRVE